MKSEDENGDTILDIDIIEYIKNEPGPNAEGKFWVLKNRIAKLNMQVMDAIRSIVIMIILLYGFALNI